ASCSSGASGDRFMRKPCRERNYRQKWWMDSAGSLRHEMKTNDMPGATQSRTRRWLAVITLCCLSVAATPATAQLIREASATVDRGGGAFDVGYDASHDAYLFAVAPTTGSITASFLDTTGHSVAAPVLIDAGGSGVSTLRVGSSSATAGSFAIVW